MENNVFFGTAFPQQTERDKRLGASDSGQFIPVWKQEARDEQGRRRFHGAFTGGFSAGYYNTVGSKEGWTPSQFVSSRSSRHEQRTARVEDFMDEEDLQALASTKELVARDEFDVLSDTEKDMGTERQLEHARRGGDLSLLTSSLMILVAPTQESIGTRLLQKMGWRPGQGVGPRTALKSEDEDENSVTKTRFQQSMTLAPKDTPIVDYQAKTNVYGLGYNLKNVPQVAEMRRFQQQQQDQHNGKGVTKFGIGMFSTPDDDSIMPYDDEPGFSQKYHHSLYDTSELNMETSTLADVKKRKGTALDLQAKKKARCLDGHLPLNGFHLSTQSQQLGKWYPPPTVPSDFIESHAQVTTDEHTTRKAKKPQSEITTDVRGAMLGETPIEARSVFDYMSSKSKERLAQATNIMKEIPVVVDKTRLQVTLVPKDAAKLALQGFMPFDDAPEKQARYRHYLEASKEYQGDPGKLTTTFEIPAGMTHESGMKELDEFTKAARIFRPISSMMSGRFTSSSSLSIGSPRTSGTVEHVSFEGGLKTEEQWKKEKEIREKQNVDEPEPKLSQKAEAASMNMFGPLTRTQLPFYPNRLLCKRFNIRNPHPDHVQQGPGHRTQAGSTTALNEKSMALMFTPSSTSSTSTLAETHKNDPALDAIIAKPSSRSNPDKESTVENATLTNQDDNDQDLTYERPTMDIFKAIFETSDDESVATEQKAETNHDKSGTIVQGSPQSHGKSMARNHLSPEPSVNISDEDFIGPPVPLDSSPSASSPPPVSSKPAFFRPMFTKRESKDTNISSQQIVVTPFQSRLSSSTKKRSQRRHVSVPSGTDSSAEEDDKEKGSRTHHRRRKSSDSKKSKKKNDGKRRKHSHEDRHRRRDKDHDNKKPSSAEPVNDMAMWVEKKPSNRRNRAEDLW